MIFLDLEITLPRTLAVVVAQWATAFASLAEGWVFESQPRQTYVVKQVVTSPLLNAQQ